jgi:hypothetical protein
MSGVFGWKQILVAGVGFLLMLVGGALIARRTASLD